MENTSSNSANAIPGEDALRDALRTVVDPEAGVNIVDLGLVYRIETQAGQVRVEMTMTSPACPMGEMIVDDVKVALRSALPSGTAVEVELVWSPPWEPAMMSDAARRHFDW
jgi:metal-sulfur cluster biosynthetic enzyme